MKLPKILFLEDEDQLAKIVSETLQSRGYSVIHLTNGRLGLESVIRSEFDLCVVDVMMPFMDGFTFAKELRKIDKTIPLLFLTARAQDRDLVEGYQVGGNDYLKKPFSLEELILRIDELLKRNHYSSLKITDSITIGDYLFLPLRQELIFKDKSPVKLSNRENELLLLLTQHTNQLLDRKAALMKVWGDDHSFNARTMDVFITKLRKHLQADPAIEIINVRGMGYKLLT